MKTHSFLSKCLQIICAITIGIVFIFNFIYNATISYNISEVVEIKNHTFRSILFSLGIIVAVIALSFFKNNIEKIKSKNLFLSFSVMYVLLGIYLICNVDHGIRYDANYVAKAAKELFAGTTAAFEKGGYIYQYPHQVGLMLYDAFLFLFCKYNVVFFIANLGLVLGINYLIYKIADLLFENALTNNISIIMAFTFLPQFFFILFAYGTIPGLFFFVFSLYHTLRFCKSHSYINLVLTVVGGCIAVILRKNFLIGIMAILIYIFLEMIKKFSLKHLVLLGCILFSLILPLKILPSIFVESGAGAPSVLWLAMGTDIDNRDRGPGWYDSSSKEIFDSSDYNAKVSGEKGKEKLKDNIKKMQQNPLKTGKFFADKIVSQWCEPMYQSLWSGPLEDCNQETKTPLLKSLYNGRIAEKILAGAMKMYMISFFGLALIFIIKEYKQHSGWQLLFLLFVGGFLFHLLWEAKSQYVYPYFFPLIPLAAFSLANVLDVVKTKLCKSGNLVERK